MHVRNLVDIPDITPLQRRIKEHGGETRGACRSDHLFIYPSIFRGINSLPLGIHLGASTIPPVSFNRCSRAVVGCGVCLVEAEHSFLSMDISIILPGVLRWRVAFPSD